MQLNCPNCHSAVEVLDSRALGGRSTLDGGQDFLATATCPNCHSRLNIVDNQQAPERLPAQRIGHFELAGKLGEGQSAIVWKALDTKLNRVVALKIPRTLEIMEQGADLFLREARAIAQLSHPHIVKLYEALSTDDMLMIVTEFIDGTTLQEHLKTNRPSHRESVRICHQLADALQHAHDQGIVHRDMKPGNVLIDRQSQLKVTDFGLAKRDVADITVTLDGQILGTPAYMSPEQAEGKNLSTDRRSDIYSLGVIFYELLTGKLPFEGTARVILDKVISGDLRSPRWIDPTIPRDLETICLKAIATLPERRYQTAGEFASDLQRFLDSQPIQAKPASKWETSWKWSRRHPWQLATAVSLVFALFVAISSSAAMGRKPVGSRSKTRNVQITSDPPKALLVCYPIDEESGDPIFESPYYSRAGAIMRLDPGNYLFCAVTSDNRFHEVYRRIPSPDGGIDHQHFRHQFSSIENGIVKLLEITIPPLDVADGMARFDGTSQFQMGDKSRQDVPPFECTIQPFYLDCKEVSLEQFRKVMKRNPSAWRLAEQRPGDMPVTGFFVDDAIAFAENSGKRLMTEAEYEYAATYCGTRKFPWGNDQKFTDWPVGPGTGAPYDVLPTVPPVYGLASNVAELTSTWALSYPGHPFRANIRSPEDFRVVRGAPNEVCQGVELKQPISDWSPRCRMMIPKDALAKNVGIRLARNVAPRIRYEDFPKIVESHASK